MKSKVNNQNDFKNRNVTGIKSILKSNGIECRVENQGDNRTFCLELKNNIKIFHTLKYVCKFFVSDISSSYIIIKAF